MEMMGIWQAFFIFSGIYFAAVAAIKSNFLAMAIGMFLFLIGAHYIK